MTTLTLDKKRLEKEIGKLTEDLQEKIVMAGVEIDSIEEEVTFDITPNRTDLLSFEGFARYMKGYLGKSKPKKYKIEKPQKDFQVTIDKSVKAVRPYTVCAIVKGLKLDDQKIKDIIEIQEKLHLTLGRKRKKLAIGVYPLEKIELPIKFEAKKPAEIKFQPLEYAKEITGAQVLRQHPTGRDYADLLKDCDVYPIFTDATGKILSMPPIINSHKVGKVELDTKDVFVECSGFNLHYLNKALNILITAMSDMGGKVYGMEIIDGKNKSTTPVLKEQKQEFKIEDVNRTLGVDFTEKQIKDNLEKMGISVEGSGPNLTALVPAWRTDVLHWVDIAEDVAIAYGYNNFEPEIPDISTIGSESPKAIKQRLVSNILASVGLLECSTFHLTTKKNIRKMHYEFNDFLEVEDSKNENNVLRADILTNLLKVLSENSDSQYPQKIFEQGTVFSLDKESKKEIPILEEDKLGILLIDEKTNFTEAKQVLDFLFKMLDKEYELEEVEDNNYILGRVGKIIYNGKEVGRIGEVAPRVLKNWKIYLPTAAIELDLEKVVY